MKPTNLIYILALSLVACTPDGEITDEKDGEPTSEPSNPSSEPPMEETLEYLNIAAIGLEYVGIWDESGDSLNSYVFPDYDGTNNGEGSPSYDYFRVTLASLEYFTQAETEEERAYQSCEFTAFYFSAPSDFESQIFDWDAGFGSTGKIAPTWGAYEGFISIMESTMTERCFALDPDVYANGQPIDLFDGIRVGVAFGEKTAHINETFESYASNDADWDEFWDANKNGHMTQFIAINHPNSDEESGFDFIGYDWNYSILVDVDMTVCQSVEQSDGSVEEFCGEILIDEETENYQFGNADLDPRFGFVSGGSFWLEDFPNLDLDLLKLGYDPCDFAAEYIEGCETDDGGSDDGGTDDGGTDDGGSDDGGTDDGGTDDGGSDDGGSQ